MGEKTVVLPGQLPLFESMAKLEVTPMTPAERSIAATAAVAYRDRRLRDSTAAFRNDLLCMQESLALVQLFNEGMPAEPAAQEVMDMLEAIDGFTKKMDEWVQSAKGAVAELAGIENDDLVYLANRLLDEYRGENGVD